MQAATQATTPAPDGRLNYGALTVVLALTQLLVILDFTMISVALPSIGKDLQIPPALLSWVISAKTIFYAGFLILGGRAADVIGQRKCLFLGIGVFAVGSLLAGLASDLPVLILARALQGLGGALLSPASFSLINTLIPEGAHRTRAYSVFGAIQGVSMFTALIMGGVLTTFVGWRSIFFVNLVFIVVGLVLTARYVPKVPRMEGPSRSLDIPGAVLISGAVGSLFVAISTITRFGIDSTPALSALAAMGACAVLFWLVERKARDPLVPPTVFKAPNLPGTAIAMLGMVMGTGGIVVMSNLYMQQRLGFSPMISGLGILPYAIGVAIAGRATAYLSRRFSSRAMMIGGIGMDLLGLAAFVSMIQGGGYFRNIMPGLSLAAFGTIVAYVAMLAKATKGVPRAEQGVATGVMFTMQQVAVALGAAAAMTAMGATLAVTGPGHEAPFRNGYLTVMAFAACGLVATLLFTRKDRAMPPPERGPSEIKAVEAAAP